MDVAFVSSQIYPFCKGGTEKRIYEIGRRLVADGHDVTVYGCHWWEGPRTIEYEGMTLIGVSPRDDQFEKQRRSIVTALRFSMDLARPLYEGLDRHDVVVACVSEHFPVWVASLATRLDSTPLVTTWHEVWDLAYWREYLGVLGPIGWLVQLVTTKLPQKPIAVSPATARKLARFRSAEGIEVVPNGVDAEAIRSVLPAETGFDVLFVGRLIPEKNVGILLEAFDRVAETHDLTLGIIGDGAHATALREQAASMTHVEDVTFLGFVEDDADVHAHMRAAEVFVLPSEREGFGITILEAMAAGCTVLTVSHPNSAASDVVGKYGFVVALSPSSITDALRRAIEGETPERNPMERVREFEWEQVAQRAEREYRSAVGHVSSVVG
jgi:glycosyltransferase involved in cell wall biosynthesis